MPAVSLCDDHNITFVQIPKNAGTSIGSWLRENKNKSNYTEWYNHPRHSEIQSKNFSFAVVRNPWDRAVSMYFFLKYWLSPPSSPISISTNSEQIRAELYRINGYQQFPEFEDWLENIKHFKMLPWIKWQVSDCQTDWLDTPVDYIIKYESLEKDFLRVQEMIDCYNPLPKLLVSKDVFRTDYKDYYNNNTISMVTEYFKKDIEQWQYEF